jgi:hypothetical protein
MYTGSKNLDLKDLSGGINVFDGSSEIFDNQCVKAVNFTVEGTKLISSPGFEERFKVGTTNNPVQGLHVDADGNVFTVQNNDIYKNGALWAGSIVRVTSVVNSYAYTVTIDGTPYVYNSDGSATKDEIVAGLKAVIDAGAIANLSTSVDYLSYFTLSDGDSTVAHLALLWEGTPLTVVAGTNLLLDRQYTSLSGYSATGRVNIDDNGDYLVFAQEDGGTLKVYHNGCPVGTSGLTATNVRCATFWGIFLLVGAGNAVYNSKDFTNAKPWRIVDFNAAPSNSRRVGNTADVVGIVTNNEKVYVGKRSDSVWTFTDSSFNTSTNLYDLPLKQLTSTGPVNQSCMTEVNQDVLYFDGLNVRRISYEANTLALKDASISVLVEPLIRKLPRDQSNACASFKYPYYNLYLRSNTAGATECDTCFKYQVEKTSWTTEDGKTVRCVDATSSDSVAGSTFDGTVWNMDVGDALGTEGRDGEFRSKHYDLGDNVGNKRFYQFQLDGSIGPNDEAYLDVYVDKGNTPKYTWAFGSNGVVKLTGTLGTLTLGTGTLGSGGTSDELIGFSHRFSMFADGPAFSFGLRYSGYTRLVVESARLTYKNLKTHNFRTYA